MNKEDKTTRGGSYRNRKREVELRRGSGPDKQLTDQGFRCVSGPREDYCLRQGGCSVNQLRRMKDFHSEAFPYTGTIPRNQHTSFRCMKII